MGHPKSWLGVVEGGGEDVFVGERGEELAGLGGEADETGGEPGLGGDGDLGAAALDGGVDAVGGVADAGGEAWSFGAEVEPAGLLAGLAGEVGMHLAAGAHEAWADGGDADAFVAELGVEALGEAGEGELGGDVGEQVRDRDLAADGGDVDDAAAGFVDGGEQVWERGLDGVEGGEEVGPHGLVVGVGSLVFDGTDVDDSGVVDEEIDAAEGMDGGFDEAGGLGLVGEVAGDEEDVVFVGHAAALQQVDAGVFEFVRVAGGEDEFEAGAPEAMGDGEAEAARAAGDDGDLRGIVALACGQKSVGGSRCKGGCDEGQREVGSRVFHGERDAEDVTQGKTPIGNESRHIFPGFAFFGHALFAFGVRAEVLGYQDGNASLRGRSEPKCELSGRRVRVGYKVLGDRRRLQQESLVEAS
jgi:hypothetical protein